MSAPRIVVERDEVGCLVTVHEGWEGMKGALGGPNCGCVKCLTARWRERWDTARREQPWLPPVPSEFELRRLFTEADFNCFGVTIRGKNGCL